MNLLEIDIAKMTAKVTDMAIEYAPTVALALITLIVGMWIIKKLINFSDKRMEGRGVELSLRKFLGSLIGIFLKIMLILSVVSMFGVNTTSFIAIASALMVGIGMALNGSIGHFASGVMIMLFKPFKVGDLVKVGGNQSLGTVESINAFNTTLETLDNQRIIIANSNITGNDITNVSGQGHVGVELTFGIGYSDDIDKAKSIIKSVGDSCPTVLELPVQGVVVAELADSSVNINTRPFCKSEDFWSTKFYMQEHVKKAFDKEGIGIPYQTIDINMVQAN